LSKIQAGVARVSAARLFFEFRELGLLPATRVQPRNRAHRWTILDARRKSKIFADQFYGSSRQRRRNRSNRITSF
jgi:hypothetical protein